jgi:5-formyltetrahydrofolate cyclo-ligase
LNATRTQPISISQLREYGKLARSSMRDRDRASSQIANRVIRSHEFSACKTLACYLPVGDEVDTSSIVLRSWRAKKRILAPVTDSHGGMTFRELQPDTPLLKNRFGLWEPAIGTTISPKLIDVVITPLVAFDDQRNRIGMGGGYFDRCFAFLKHRHHWLRPKLIGVAFDCQKVEKIVPNPWDIRLYQVFTETN